MVQAFPTAKTGLPRVHPLGELVHSAGERLIEQHLVDGADSLIGVVAVDDA